MARQFLIDDACKFRMLANYCGQAEVHKCFSMGSVCVPCLFAYLINLIFFASVLGGFLWKNNKHFIGGRRDARFLPNLL